MHVVTKALKKIVEKSYKVLLSRVWNISPFLPFVNELQYWQATPHSFSHWSIQGHKKATVTTRKESKEKREIIEESKENLKAKSDDSGEEKNGDDDSQKNGPKKKGECGTFTFPSENLAVCGWAAEGISLNQQENTN